MEIELNLPKFQCRIKQEGQKRLIFDQIRKIFVALTPEEWVRQNFLNYLVIHLNYPPSLLGIEKSFNLNNLNRRADIVVHSRIGHPVMLVECKSPNIKINQKAFDQAVRYNMVLKVNYIVVTNGLEHFCCKIDYQNQKYFYLKDIPEYDYL